MCSSEPVEDILFQLQRIQNGGILRDPDGWRGLPTAVGAEEHCHDRERDRACDSSCAPAHNGWRVRLATKGFRTKNHGCSFLSRNEGRLFRHLTSPSASCVVPHLNSRRSSSRSATRGGTSGRPTGARADRRSGSGPDLHTERLLLILSI